MKSAPQPVSGAFAVRPPSPRRVIGLLLAGLSLVVGCSRVHSRQWGYPPRFGRRMDALKGSGRVGKVRSPQVNLRFEPDPVVGGVRATRRPDG